MIVVDKEFEARATAALAEYGVTDVTFDWLEASCVDGKPMCFILTPSTDRLEVAEMIAKDILEPLYFDIGGFGAGVEFRHKAVEWAGGCAFWGKVTDAYDRALNRLRTARAGISLISDPMEQDRLSDLAEARYWQEIADASEAERRRAA